MDQWDEERQDWAAAPHPDGPPSGSRPRRMLVVAIAAVLLAAAAGTGIWLLARDGSSHITDQGGVLPGVLPSSSPTGDGSVSTTPASPGASIDPCTAVDATTAQQLGLGTGLPDDPTNSSVQLKSCKWSYSGPDGRETATFHLIYTREVPVSPSPTPIPVAGVPSAVATGNDNACAVLWPASFGEVLVHVARVNEGPQRDLCSLASDFAGAVAPRVPK
ncbi:DUF3558 domain-containing protein [Streptomyces sp. NBC_01456]|uniref:DUF3558 family protein n=1 Tax=unclassified Streptomyces TaxID=2593676 RepID=UPI002E33293D|nr:MULTISPECIES: DUF3558 family protein [unclassified Streptomyces]